MFGLFKSHPKELSIIYTEGDLEIFKNRIISEKDVDNIIYLMYNIDKNHHSSYYFGISHNHIELVKLAYKQAILDYAYLNFKNQLNQDYFGEHSCNSASYHVAEDNGQDSNCIAAGYFQLPVLSRHTYGWELARKLNLKCSERIKISFKI